MACVRRCLLSRSVLIRKFVQSTRVQAGSRKKCAILNIEVLEPKILQSTRVQVKHVDLRDTIGPSCHACPAV